MDEPWPSSLCHAIGVRGGEAMCARLEEEERVENDMWGQARKRRKPFHWLAGLRGEKERGDGPREKNEVVQLLRISLHFPNKQMQRGKAIKENARGKRKSYKNMIWNPWTFCDFLKLV